MPKWNFTSSVPCSGVGQGLSQLKAQDLSPLWHSIWDISEWESAPKWTWSKKNLSSAWISHLFWVALNFDFVTLLLFNSHWQWMFLNSFWPLTLYILAQPLKKVWWRLWRSWMTIWEPLCQRRLMQTALKKRRCPNASFWMEMTSPLLTATFCPNSMLSR